MKINGLRRLASAVIDTSISDLEEYVAILKMNPGEKMVDKAVDGIREIKRFFCSNWFEILCSLSGFHPSQVRRIVAEVLDDRQRIS